MKKVLKWIIIVVVLIILGIDFYGLWKYKLNGKQYVLETGGDDAASEESRAQREGRETYGIYDEAIKLENLNLLDTLIKISDYSLEHGL